MSVTFSIKGGGYLFDENGEETGEPYVNFASANARRVLLQLQLPGHDCLCGEVRSRELRNACEKYLSDPVVELELARPHVISAGSNGATIIECGHESGSFSRRVEALYELAKTAGDLGVIVYG
jgi:hypothetical protein